MKTSHDRCGLLTGNHPLTGSHLWQEEIFGPVLPVCMVKDVSAAVDVVRSRHKPLALYLFSKS
jgi:aldehyde dehydrogenase (NAD+)